MVARFAVPTSAVAAAEAVPPVSPVSLQQNIDAIFELAAGWFMSMSMSGPTHMYTRLNLRSKWAFLFPRSCQCASCCLLQHIHLKQWALQQRDWNGGALNHQWLHEPLPAVKCCHNQNTLRHCYWALADAAQKAPRHSQLTGAIFLTSFASSCASYWAAGSVAFSVGLHIYSGFCSIEQPPLMHFSMCNLSGWLRLASLP